MRGIAILMLGVISACDAPPPAASPPPATSSAPPSIEAPVPSPAPAPPAPSTALTGDAVDRLVAKLDASPMWINGGFPKIDLPASTPTADVVKVVFQKVSFDSGPVKSHQIQSHRTVSIGGTGYEAVVVDTDLGLKIVLLRHQPSTGWWSRVFDASAPPSAAPASAAWDPARCDAERRTLDAALQKSLTCGGDAECTTIAYACLGSCGRAVSASRLGTLRERLDAFQAGCGTRCPVPKCAPWVTNAPNCHAGSCVIPKT